MLVLQSDAAPYHTPARAKRSSTSPAPAIPPSRSSRLAFCAGAASARGGGARECRQRHAVGKVGTATVTAASSRRSCRERSR